MQQDILHLDLEALVDQSFLSKSSLLCPSSLTKPMDSNSLMEVDSSTQVLSSLIQVGPVELTFRLTVRVPFTCSFGKKMLT